MSGHDEELVEQGLIRAATVMVILAVLACWVTSLT